MANVQRALNAATKEGQRNGLAQDVARIHAWATAVLAYYGYTFPDRPDITSGYRSPEKQSELLAAWERGDREGLRAKPAERSWHMAERDGEPAARAWDVQNEVRAYRMYETLMRRLGNVRVGADFTPPDVGHFSVPSGQRPPSIESGSSFFGI